MNNENQYLNEQKKNNGGLIIIIVILIIIVIGLGGYIIYDKYIINDNINPKVNEIENNTESSNINLSDEEIKKFITDDGTQPLLGIYYNEPKEIITLTQENDNYLTGMRAMEYCVEQTQSNTDEDVITEDEKAELSKKYNKDFNFYDSDGNVTEYTFNSSVKGSTIQKIFEEKTGYKLSNDELKKLVGNTHYLEKYDEYYYWISDAFIDNIQINSITQENGLYKVKYTKSSNRYGTAVLKYNTNTNQINIISNQK